MRVLILHDYLDNIGGGEKLMLTLARDIGADVATLDYNPAIVEAMGFKGIRISGFGSTPKLPPLKQITASVRHWLCDFSKEYDYFIFSGNWAHYSTSRHRPNLWYCYTPVRAFYSDYESLKARLSPPQRLAYTAWVAMHSRFDRASARRVDKLVTISKTVRERVRRTYGRESNVVYPGVDTVKFKNKGYGDYWLSVNRLYPEKRVELQAQAFSRMPQENLVVVGSNLEGDHSGGYARKLVSEAPKNVKYLGRISEAELSELYSKCKGLLCTASDEDFGMTPVEAMAAGKAVIATREGGYLETVIDGETGVFVEATSEGIMGAIRELSGDPGKYRRACEARARQFDTKAFINGMRAEIGI